MTTRIQIISGTRGASSGFSPRVGRAVTVPGTEEVTVDADECLARSATVFAGAGMERDRALALVNRAEVAAAAGDHPTAAALREQARRILVGLDLAHLFGLVDDGAGP